jgi:hypothetical protein
MEMKFCGTGGNQPILLLIPPSGGQDIYLPMVFSRWRYPCPSGTSIGMDVNCGAVAANYDPPATSSNRTYAVQVNPAGTPDCGVQHGRMVAKSFCFESGQFWDRN